MSLSSYGNQLNLVLEDLVSYLTTQIGADINIYVSKPRRDPLVSDYPMFVINDLSSTGTQEFVGEKITGGEGEWHLLSYQGDIYTKRDAFVDNMSEQVLLRKLQVVIEEEFRLMDDNVNSVFTSAPVIRVLAGDFIDLSYLEEEGIFRKACVINVMLSHVRF